MHYSFDFFTIKPYCTFQSGLLDWSQNCTWQKKSCCNEKFFEIYQFGWVIFIIVFWFLLSSLNGHIVYFCSCKWFNCPWLCIKSSIAITIGTKSDDFTDCSIFLISAAIIEPTWDLVIYSMMPQGIMQILILNDLLYQNQLKKSYLKMKYCLLTFKAIIFQVLKPLDSGSETMAYWEFLIRKLL